MGTAVSNPDTGSRRRRALVCAPIIAWLVCAGGCAHVAAGDRDAQARPDPASRRVNARLPRGYHPGRPVHVTRAGAGIIIDLFARSFAQGSAVYIEIHGNPAAGNAAVSRALFDGKEVPLAERPWGYRGIFGIHPGTAPGERTLIVEYSAGGGARRESVAIRVAKSPFAYNPKPMDLGKYSDVDYRPTREEERFIARCAAKKKKAFARSGPDLLGGALSHPRDRHAVTSTFWAQRFIMRYRKAKGRTIQHAPRRNVHRGVDLRGRRGDPVYAMADGKIVIAEPMYYEGNFIVIDHGKRFFTYYMHLDSLRVKEGDRVSAGKLIGTVGSTGLSTAAHLHVSAVIRDTEVDPMSLLALPVRE